MAKKKKAKVKRSRAVTISRASAAQLVRELRRRHKAQVAELAAKRGELLGQIEALNAEMEGLQGALPAPKAMPKPKKRARRSAEDVKELEGPVLKALEAAATPMPISEIAEAAGLQTADIGVPLRNLLKAKAIRKRGQRGKARYSVRR